MELYTISNESSANRRRIDFHEIVSPISLMYIRKQSGSNTVRRGTSDRAGLFSLAFVQ